MLFLLCCGGLAHAQLPLSSVEISSGDSTISFKTVPSLSPGFRVRFDSTVTRVGVEGNTVTEVVVYNRNQAKVETTYSPRGVVRRIAPAAGANGHLVPHGFHYIFYPTGSIYQMSRWSFGELKQTVHYNERGQVIRVFNYQHNQLVPPRKSTKVTKK
ncbi:hypothetical protein Q5H92_10675 [Hymenobacter sp. M29]|uniref:Uncharacterized protein n=1 Tax=Hymenobacter mellowenesis TaxID=3063995 RepID=A0ABT9AAF7_9BACT|nr:hypothetical protein [Hymenobacter sp. M29]MDO7846822.1 hypothetical protein [Hymenobacter sp. M29]